MPGVGEVGEEAACWTWMEFDPNSGPSQPNREGQNRAGEPSLRVRRNFRNGVDVSRERRCSRWSCFDRCCGDADGDLRWRTARKAAAWLVDWGKIKHWFWNERDMLVTLKTNESNGGNEHQIDDKCIQNSNSLFNQ